MIRRATELAAIRAIGASLADDFALSARIKGFPRIGLEPPAARLSVLHVKQGIRIGRLIAAIASTLFVASSAHAASLDFSTYLGATGPDSANAVTADANGFVYVAGATSSPDFAATAGAYDTEFDGDASSSDLYVAKLDPDGRLVWATFLGGSGEEGVTEAGSRGYVLYTEPQVSVGRDGSVYVSGRTASPDFPTTEGAFDRTHNGGFDGFAAKLSKDGSSLLYSTYIGGAGDDIAYLSALHRSDALVLAGVTSSDDFPATPGAFRTTRQGAEDAFVAKLAPDGAALEFATYLGGAAEDTAFGVALDRRGTPWVIGRTMSSDFPTSAGAFDRTHNGDEDGFVVRLSRDGSSLRFATVIGGEAHEHVASIAVDSKGAGYVVGHTRSHGFPTTPRAFDRSYGATPQGEEDAALYFGDDDAFAAKFTPRGRLAYSTLLGGTGRDYAFFADVTRNGTLWLAGDTTSADLPLSDDAFDRTFNGVTARGAVTFADAWVGALGPTGARLRYSSYLGGSAPETAWSVSAKYGSVLVAGQTFSPDFPITVGAHDTIFAGPPVSTDGWVTRLKRRGSR
jgi:hypothetical protein